MTSMTFFLVFIPVLASILLLVNLLLAPHSPYQEKNSAFECGFHSFLGQNRTQFSISFFIFALLFLLFDLEILLVYPYVVSAYTNDLYGLIIMLVFFLVLTLGFAFELGKEALKIDSRQDMLLSKNQPTDYMNIENYSNNLLNIKNTVKLESAVMSLSLIIFLIGVLGFVLNRKNIILMLISIEIMLLSITLLILVSSLGYDDILGQTFAVYIISIAGAESAIGLGILVAFYRLRGSIAIEYK